MKSIQNMKTNLGGWSWHFNIGAVALLAFAIGGCGSGGEGTGSTASATQGQVLVSVTDAQGDFLSYAVDVQSLTLTRRDGAVVETLPLSTRIDFSEYVELTEFLTAATVPNGVYTSAKMRLNYASADIQVEDAAGNAVQVPASNIKEANGNPVTTLDLDVKFDDRKALVVAPGIPAHLTLDFNLSATHEVDFSSNPPTVTVEPVLIADVEPERSKPHRVRGPMKSVDVVRSSYNIFIRPVHRLYGEHGAFTVQTDANTMFEIDGIGSQGTIGLTQLSGKLSGTATLAVGEWHRNPRRFLAQEVLAGSSLPWGTADVVTGHVIARAGDELTVLGATLIRQDGTFIFRDRVKVLVASTTQVKKQAAPGIALDKGDISVGQRVLAFGRLEAGEQLLHAENGLVRLLVTSVSGPINAVGAGSLEMTVQRIDRRRVGLFNFAGTGTAPANDADPAHYEVATGGLSLSGITVGTPTRVLGFITRFGIAPPDFTARTVVNLSAKPGTMLVNWQPKTAALFTTSSSAGLVLNLVGTGKWHHVFRGPVATDLLTLGTAPTVAPEDPTHGLYAIANGGRVEVFTDFERYRLALDDHLVRGDKAHDFGAHGTFADATATMTADQILTILR